MAGKNKVLEIIAFDSLSEWHEVRTGSRHNRSIDILGEGMADPGHYSWVEQMQLRVREVLRDRPGRGPSSGHRLSDDRGIRVDSPAQAVSGVCALSGSPNGSRET